MLEPQHRPLHDMLDLPGFSEDTAPFESDTLSEPPRPWWRQRWAVIGGVALAVILLVGIVLTALASRRTPAVYQYATATQGDLTLTVTATGPLQSAIYDVNFSGSAKLAEIDVKIGQQVTAGQTLARLDVTSLQDAVNQAQAGVSAAQTSLSNALTNQSKIQAQTQAQLAEAYDQEQLAIQNCNSPKSSPGTPTPTPSAACINQAHDQYNAAVAQANAQNSSAAGQVSSAQAQLNSAQTQLTTAQHNLGNATITASHAGTVAVINGTVGGSPGVASSTSTSGASGGSGGGVFIQIADLSSLQAQANINEADIGNVALGEAARFTVSAYGTRVFRGTVSAVSPIGQTVSNVVTYPVTIDVDTQGLTGVNLLPGMTANVTISTAQLTGVLLIPTTAVTFARSAANPNDLALISRSQVGVAMRQARQMLADLESADATVAKVNPLPAYVLERTTTGAWVVKPVVLGLFNGSLYEVLSGLSQGDRVVVGQAGASGAATSSGAGGTRGGGFGGGGGRGGFGGGG